MNEDMFIVFLAGLQQGEDAPSPLCFPCAA
jgi:hypothetical protein